MKDDDDETVREARRTLDRIGEEGGLSATPAMKSAAKGVRDHFAAADADKTDPAEVWGTRIARALALVALIGLVWFLFGQIGR
ncbi:MAG: hypothetical protein RIC18_09090 [Hoeflea sp.]|uniref:hypothetical protein n=1 Tax=Hoeflea sp. TaxID=1940281 RepID=UPI0032EB2C0D